MLRHATLFAVLLLSIQFAQAVQVSLTTHHARCGNDNGRVIATISGGTAPYSYAWSTGATGNQITALAAGTYTVTVTDGAGGTASATTQVQQINQLAPAGGNEIRTDCDGTCSGWIQVGTELLGGTPPYTFSHNPMNVLEDAPNLFTLHGICANDPPPLTITDANGCAGTVTFEISNATWFAPEILFTTPACGALANGTVVVDLGFQARITGQNFDSIYVSNGNPSTLGGLPAGTYTLILWDPFGSNISYCTGETEFTIEGLPAPCGEVSGRLFHDADQDCVFNNNDIPLPNRVLTIGPDEVYTITDANGFYSRPLPYGSYTLLQPLDDVVQLCPAAVPVPFTLTELMPSVVIDLADNSTFPHDIGIHFFYSSAVRPGFPTSVSILVKNHSAYPSGALAIDLQYDPLLIDPTPAIAQWNLPILAPYATEVFTFSAMVPADVNLLGTQITYTATVTNTAYEPDLTNNSASITRTITGSYDPNDKLGTANGSLSNSSYFLAQDEWIDYTIRFQNTGSDTAFTVVIRDTLDQLLDIPTLDILGSSHVFTTSFEEGRTLAFTFNNILLPDSTTDLLGSQGFVSYRIKPVNSIMVGDVIENTAGIYFDFNPPIITNTTSHVVEISTQLAEHERRSIRVYPNPANESLMIRLPHGMTLTSAEVFSTDGRSFRIHIERSMDTCTIDVSMLSPGAYLVKVQHANGSAVARFVKE